MQVVIGCDVGGASVKAGVITSAGELLAKRSIPTGAIVDEAAYAEVIALFNDVLADAGCTSDDLVGIGLDMPGAVLPDGTHYMHFNVDIDAAGLRAAIARAFPQVCAPATGDATAVPDAPATPDAPETPAVPAAPAVPDVSRIPCVNDANAAALGEMWMGSAKGSKSLVFVILGTGVGGGIVTDGRLLVGGRGAGGEIGHICVNPNERRSCSCGRKGCVEQYASWRGIIDSYRIACEAVGCEPVDTSAGAIAVFDEFRKGDMAAAWAIQTMCSALGQGLASVACVCDPDVFVLGGGVSGSFADFEPALRQAYRMHAIENCQDIPFVPAALGNDAGLFGSAYLALETARG